MTSGLPAPYEAELARIVDAAAGRFARWDDDLFEQVLDCGVRYAVKRWKADALAVQVFRVYLELAAEAVGAGYIDQATFEDRDHERWLGHLWTTVLPRALWEIEASLPQAMVGLWNLAEGLERQPSWISSYVAACHRAAGDALLSPQAAADFLDGVLTPIYRSPPPRDFASPLTAEVLVLEDPLYSRFLPGRIELSLPAVACVHDRRDPDVRVGVLLQADAPCRPLGLLPPFDPLDARSDLADLSPQVAPGRLRIAGQEVSLPFYGAPHEHAVFQSGHVLLDALDSQQLWVVRSS